MSYRWILEKPFHVLSGSILFVLALGVLIGVFVLIFEQLPSLRASENVGLQPFRDMGKGPVATPELTPAGYLPFVAKNYPGEAGVSPTPAVTLSSTPSLTPSPSTTLTATERPTATPTSTPSSTSASTIFGVTGPGDAPSRQLALQAGARWFRTSIRWSSIELTNLDLSDSANGNWPDSRLRALVDEGFTPVLLVTTNPDWAVETVATNPDTGQPYNCGPMDAEDLPEFQAFMQALAERYDGDGFKDAVGSPVIEHFEMYNEPEKLFTHAWTGCWAGDGSPSYGQRYAEMLSYAWQGVHAANPDAKVLFGGIGAEEGTGGDFDMDGGDWLDDVLGYIQVNPGAYFDWMNVHLYWFFRDRWVPYGGPGLTGKVNYIRQRLNQFGLDKPLIVTETTLPSDSYGSDELQSRYAVQVFARGLAAGLEGITWHRMKDVPGESRYGLLDANGNPKMSYWVYKTTTDERRDARYERDLNEGDVGASDIEGYVFQVPEAGAKWVLWAHGVEGSRQVVLPFDRVRVVPKQKYNETYPDTEIPGAVVVIVDGGPGDLDGTADGKIALNVSASPIFVQGYP